MGACCWAPAWQAWGLLSSCSSSFCESPGLQQGPCYQRPHPFPTFHPRPCFQAHILLCRAFCLVLCLLGSRSKMPWWVTDAAMPLQLSTTVAPSNRGITPACLPSLQGGVHCLDNHLCHCVPCVICLTTRGEGAEAPRGKLGDEAGLCMCPGMQVAGSGGVTAAPMQPFAQLS